MQARTLALVGPAFECVSIFTLRRVSRTIAIVVAQGRLGYRDMARDPCDDAGPCAAQSRPLRRERRKKKDASAMTLCPIALAVGCKKCPAFSVCPLKSVIGDHKEEKHGPEQSAKDSKHDTDAAR
jgi:hypothetical protein